MKVFIGQKVKWRNGKRPETIYDWKYNAKGELEIRVSPWSWATFWNIWFFDLIQEDGNIILKDLVDK